MKRKKLRITEADYLKAKRRASRQEEIESHGHPVQGRAIIHKSKKVYDRNRMKRAAIKSDDSSHFFIHLPNKDNYSKRDFSGLSYEIIGEVSMLQAMVLCMACHSTLRIA